MWATCVTVESACTISNVIGNALPSTFVTYALCKKCCPVPQVTRVVPVVVFIVAVLYQLAHVDHVYSEEEDRDIKKVAEIFGLEETYLQIIQRKILLFFKNLKREKKDEN